MTNAEKVIKNKMGLIKLAEQLGNVSQACKIMGYSRDSFSRRTPGRCIASKSCTMSREQKACAN